MENKKIALLSKIITISLVALSILIAYLAWNYTMASGFQIEYKTPESARVEIKDMYLENIQTPPSYGTPVSPDEDGYGRTNPFAEYK